MVNFLQYFDFSHHTLGVCRVLDPRFFKNLNCNKRSFFNMFSKFYGAKSSFSKIIKDFIVAGKGC